MGIEFYILGKFFKLFIVSARLKFRSFYREWQHKLPLPDFYLCKSVTIITLPLKFLWKFHEFRITNRNPIHGNRVLSQQLQHFKVVITKVWELQYYGAITRAQWVYSMRLKVKGRRKRAAGNSPSDRFLPTKRCRIIQSGDEESFKRLIFSTMNSISRYTHANCLNKRCNNCFDERCTSDSESLQLPFPSNFQMCRLIIEIEINAWKKIFCINCFRSSFWTLIWNEWMAILYTIWYSFTLVYKHVKLFVIVSRT